MAAGYDWRAALFARQAACALSTSSGVMGRPQTVHFLKNRLPCPPHAGHV